MGILKRLFGGSSANADGYFSSAYDDFMRKKYARAKGGFLQALELDPNHKEALFYLGQVYMVEENARDAVRVLERAAELFGNKADPVLYRFLGISYGCLEQHADSIRAFERAAKGLPRDTWLHGALAVAYGSAGRNGDVYNAVQILVSLDPPRDSLGYVIIWLALQFIKARNIWETHEMSKSMFQIARALDPSLPKNCDLSVAKTLVAKGIQLRSSVKQKREVVYLIPWFLAGFDILGRAAAAEEMAQCLEHFGWICHNMGWYGRAIDISKEALRKFSLIPNSNWDEAICKETIGRAFGRLGNKDEEKKWHAASRDSLLEAGPGQLMKEAVRYRWPRLFDDKEQK